ncbi:MAG: amino acid permease [Spirochaetia bacterium]|nr:amino acid permease [Spirochaetia bacterium]
MVENEKTEDFFSEDTELKRSLGITEAFSIIIGRIIGSGIFKTPGPMMIAVGGATGLFFGAWVIGGIATILSAVLYAELTAMMPRSGGPYVFLKAAYPPVWTFLRGWAMFFVSETASIVAVALVFSEYGSVIFELTTGIAPSHSAEITAALILIWSLTLVNFFGVGFSGIFQNIFSFLKIASLFAIIGASAAGSGSFSHITEHASADNWDLGAMFGVVAALRYGFFAYSGWEGATYVAEEIKNPRKNLPLSLFFGIGGVMILYLAVNVSYLYMLTPSEIMISNKRIASDAMSKALGSFGGIMIAAAVVISTFGNVSTQILVKSRTWYSMARDGLFFSPLARLNSNYKTPNAALAAQAVWASVLLFAASFNEKTYESIIDFFSFTSAVFNVSTFLSVFVLRKKYPDAPRPYKAWGYPWTLIIVLVIHLWFMIVTLIDAFIPSLAGILLTCSGFLYYYRDKIFRFKSKR